MQTTKRHLLFKVRTKRESDQDDASGYFCNIFKTESAFLLFLSKVLFHSFHKMQKLVYFGKASNHKTQH